MRRNEHKYIVWGYLDFFDERGQRFDPLVVVDHSRACRVTLGMTFAVPARNPTLSRLVLARYLKGEYTAAQVRAWLAGVPAEHSAGLSRLLWESDDFERVLVSRGVDLSEGIDLNEVPEAHIDFWLKERERKQDFYGRGGGSAAPEDTGDFFNLISWFSACLPPELALRDAQSGRSVAQAGQPNESGWNWVFSVPAGQSLNDVLNSVEGRLLDLLAQLEPTINPPGSAVQ